MLCHLCYVLNGSKLKTSHRLCNAFNLLNSWSVTYIYILMCLLPFPTFFQVDAHIMWVCIIIDYLWINAYITLINFSSLEYCFFVYIKLSMCIQFSSCIQEKHRLYRLCIKSPVFKKQFLNYKKNLLNKLITM